MKESTYEPIAVVRSKSRWYQNRDTNQGVCFHPIVPIGYLPAMQVFLDQQDMGAVFSVKLKRDDESVVSDYAPSVNIKTTTHGGTALIQAARIAGMVAGVYYFEYSVSGGETFVSEPFLMRDVSGMVHITYESTDDIEVKNGVVSFRSGSNRYAREVWIDSDFLMPPFSFDEEVTSRDGFDFVEKKVSYKNHKLWMMCSEYFADALRMMWHCDTIKMERDGEVYDVDQMTLGIDWGESNYLCRADIEIRTDTIIQTNGVSIM